jgi:putative peptide zinc metalloprotease protein
MRRTVLAFAAAAAFIGLVPLPFHSVQQAVVWLPDEAIVRAEGAGHVAAVQLAPGAVATPGQALLTLDSPPLLAELGSAAGAVAQAQAQLRKAEVDEPVRVQTLKGELAARQARLDEAQRRVQALAVQAGAAGRWTPAAPTELPGRYVKRGEVLGYLVAGPSRLVRVAVPQEDMNLIAQRLQQVQVRLANQPDEAVAARLRRRVPGGEFDLVSPALGTSGGGDIAVDPAQQGGTRSLKRVFDLEVELDRPSSRAVFGDRAHVRFDLGAAPLGWQWFLRLRQVFLAQLNV